jgi:hypothetical protein
VDWILVGEATSPEAGIFPRSKPEEFGVDLPRRADV